MILLHNITDIEGMKSSVLILKKVNSHIIRTKLLFDTIVTNCQIVLEPSEQPRTFLAPDESMLYSNISFLHVYAIANV